MQHTALLMALGLLAASCASDLGGRGERVIPTLLGEWRYQHHGFAAYPPQATGWWLPLHLQTAEEAIYWRDPPSETHGAYCEAKLQVFASTPKLNELPVDPKPGDLAGHPLELVELSHEASTRQGQPCVEFRYTSLDRQAASSPSHPLRVRQIGWFCLHPSIRGGAIRAAYVERGQPEELDPGLEHEARDCLNSFEIQRLPDEPAAQLGAAADGRSPGPDGAW